MFGAFVRRVNILTLRPLAIRPRARIPNHGCQHVFRIRCTITDNKHLVLQTYMMCPLPTLPTSRVRWLWLQAIISKLYAVISLESHFRAWGRWHSEICVCQNEWVSWYPMGITKVIRRKLHRVNIEVLLRSYIFRLSGKLLNRHMGYL